MLRIWYFVDHFFCAESSWLEAVMRISTEADYSGGDLHQGNLNSSIEFPVVIRSAPPSL